MPIIILQQEEIEKAVERMVMGLPYTPPETGHAVYFKTYAFMYGWKPFKAKAINIEPS